jgi:hypothetical protein
MRVLPGIIAIFSIANVASAGHDRDGRALRAANNGAEGDAIMSTSIRLRAAFTLLCGLASLSAHAEGTNRNHAVYARTAEQISAAILQANNSGRPTIIRVARNTYEPTTSFDSDFGASRFPPVTGVVLITGHSANDTVFKTGGLRGFTVLAGGHLALLNLTIREGAAICSSQDCEERGGGAVLNREGVLWIERCVLSNNVAFHSEGTQAGHGGAILSVRGRLDVIDSTVENNTSLAGGGGIEISAGRASIRHSIIRGNSLRGGVGNEGLLMGGGLLISGATVSVVDSTFSANSAGELIDDWIGFGAAIHNTGGTVWMKNSSVVENTVVPVGSGAGIFNDSVMTIENSTIAGNSAGTLGGGIFNSGTLTLRGVTIARNEVLSGVLLGPAVGQPSYPPGCDVLARELCFTRGGGIWNEPGGRVILRTTALSENTKGEGEESDCSGTLISKGRNAISSDTDCIIQHAHSAQGADLVNLDLRLGELVDNAQPGDAYVPLLADSPLIDAGGRVSEDCTRRDQIGNARTDGNGDGNIRCDIGAIEFTEP